MVKFGYTICYVPNVDETLQFFEKAFGMTRRFLTEENDYGELDTGTTVFAFASEELGQSNLNEGYVKSSESKQPLGVEVVLVSEDVENAYKNAIENGATDLKEPEEKPWGQIVSYVRSPSGILLEICSPIGN